MINNTSIFNAVGGKWLLPGVISVVIISLIIPYFMTTPSDGHGGHEAISHQAVAETATAADAHLVPMTEKESMKVRLPGGVELDAYKGGIEDQLIKYLNDPAAKTGKDVWFNFDNINFETGSAALTAKSDPQVKNIVAILKAYPGVSVKVGGYTDKTGDSLANLKLSQSRAETVVAALKTSGASGAQILGGEGYGSQFAVAAADAPDELREKDRRIALSVRQK